jgi:hypothetical protein
MKLSRTNAVLPFESASDFTGLSGRFVVLKTGKISPVNPTNFKPIGVLLTEGLQGDQVSVAIAAGGLAGTVRVRLSTATTAVVTHPGVELQLTDDGRVHPDTGTGARTLVAVALEPGSPGQLIEAALFRPVALT